MVPERASIKLVELIKRNDPFLFTRGLIRCCHPPHQPPLLQILRKIGTLPDRGGTPLEGHASVLRVSCFRLRRVAGKPCSKYVGITAVARGPLARHFGCSPIPTYELDEAFDAEPFKYVRNYSQHSLSESDEQKMSVRVELPRAGILDKELLRKRRTRPFTEKWRMQSLGVGLYRDKLRNRRCFTTLGSLERQPGSSCAIMSEKEMIGVQKEKAQVASKQNEDELSLECSGDESDHVVFIDSDSDDEPMASKLTEESVEALEASLRDLEASTHTDKSKIGATCLKLAQLCDDFGDDPLKVLVYGERALKVLKPPEVSFENATCFQLVGSAHYKLDDSPKAVPHLERAALILKELGAMGKEQGTTMALQSRVQVYLGLAKMSLGRKEEALGHYQEAIMIKERAYEPGSLDLAQSYLQAADAYTEADKHEEALSLCMKALPIYLKHHGPSSYQVASLRRLISITYNDIGEHEKALSEHEKIRPILKRVGKCKELASLNLASGETLVSLEKYKEAIHLLKGVVDATKERSHSHGRAFVLIGKAYAALEEENNSMIHCKKAFSALKNKKDSLDAASSLRELASVYEQLNKQEQAVVILKRCLEIYEQFPEEHQSAADIEDQIRLYQDKC